jgi:threonine/homoserine/homoserine lactone efflux protein
MSPDGYFYLILGFLGSFVGTIPFGPINLSVVDTTLKDGMRGAMIFALAAAIIEFIYAYLSLSFYWVLNEQIASSRLIPMLVVIVFFLGGLFFFFKKDKRSANGPENKRKNNFIKGFIIAVLNPQAIPFWIFVIGFYQMQHYLNMHTIDHLDFVLAFVIGAALGKITCLYLFVLLSKRIAHRLGRISALMNKIIGVVLFFIATVQLVQLF